MDSNDKDFFSDVGVAVGIGIQLLWTAVILGLGLAAVLMGLGVLALILKVLGGF